MLKIIPYLTYKYFKVHAKAAVDAERITGRTTQK